MMCEHCNYHPALREWVGLTEQDFWEINQLCVTKLQVAIKVEIKLKEKKT